MASRQDTHGAADRAVTRVRTRLTLWYAGTFTVILLLLGVALFVAVRRQISQELDDSLTAATLELAHVASSREIQHEKNDSALIDAVDELRIPQRTLYLLDATGSPIAPVVADPWIHASALVAAKKGVVSTWRDTDDDRTLRLEARRFRTQGRTLVAVAVADQVELEDRYADLIGAFAAMAVIAIVLVAAGGWFLARQSTAPIEANLSNMRRFMADAAHQLKTPIAILRTNADVALQRTRDADEYRGALESVESESRRLGVIVDRLLVLARADAGARSPEKKPLYLDDIASDCIGAARRLAERKSVVISVDAFEETPVNADQTLLHELIVILLDNAIKFSRPGGKVSIRVEMQQDRPTLTIADSGIGIKPADLPRVFDRFYRAEGGRSGYEGAGLGLSIAQWITDEHGADISIESQPDVGATVKVSFPRPTTV